MQDDPIEAAQQAEEEQDKQQSDDAPTAAFLYAVPSPSLPDKQDMDAEKSDAPNNADEDVIAALPEDSDFIEDIAGAIGTVLEGIGDLLSG